MSTYDMPADYDAWRTGNWGDDEFAPEDDADAREEAALARGERDEDR